MKIYIHSKHERHERLRDRLYKVFDVVVLGSEFPSSFYDYVIFPHCSQIITTDIIEKYQCISFHIGDLPNQAGGSPIQNIILSGNYNTKLTAFEPCDKIDAGGIYLKKDIELTGSLTDILNKCDDLIYHMVLEIINNDIRPAERHDVGQYFTRRKPHESELIYANYDKLYDFIRMLDDDSYPRAFVNINDYVIEFSKAKINNQTITANVKFKRQNHLSGGSTPG